MAKMPQEVELETLCPKLADGFKKSQIELKQTVERSLSDELKSLYLLFIHAARLQDYVNPEWLLHEFNGAKPPPNPYSTAKKAKEAFHAHLIHRWLHLSLPEIMSRAPTDLMREFGFVFELLSHLIVAQATSNFTKPKGRPDKRRATARRRVAFIIKDLDDGIFPISRKEREILKHLIGKASDSLRRQRPKEISYPILMSLARTFMRYNVGAAGPISAKLLMEAASFMELDCDPSTASRYTALPSGNGETTAYSVWSGNSGEARLDFPLFEILRDDHLKTRRQESVST